MAETGDAAVLRSLADRIVPQTPGSVIVATVYSSYGGKEGRRILLRRPLAPFYSDSPWIAHQDVCDVMGLKDEDLSDVTVLIDAAHFDFASGAMSGGTE